MGLEVVYFFDFCGWHLYSFFICGRAWGSSTEYVSPDYFVDLGSWGLGVDGKRGADEMLRSSLGLEPGQRFLYLFDYGDDWRFEVQFLGHVASEEGADYPRITERRGGSPPQHPEDQEEPSNNY